MRLTRRRAATSPASRRRVGFAATLTVLFVVASWLSPAWVYSQFPFRAADPRRPIAVEVDVDEAGGDARKFLDQIDAFLQDGQWSEAVDAVQKVMAEYGDKVVLVHKTANNFRHYVSVRDYCQRRLVDPKFAAVLDVYRPRVDPLAKQWYETGLAKRDEKLLQRIVDEAFAGSWTDEALYALGELALSRGDAPSARAAWTRIFPPDPNQPAAAAAAYPDSDLKPADVDARLVLASILQGDRARAAEELDRSLRGGPGFTQRYPETRGRLGGKEGKYADLLRDLLKQSESWPTPRPDDDWPTFAGDYERNAIAPSAVAVAGKAWKNPIDLKAVSVMPAAISREYSQRRVGETSGRPLAYVPSVSGDRLVIHQQVASADNAQMGVDQILVYNLETGGPAGAQPVVYTSDKWPLYSPKSLGVPRFTTTIFGNRIYACLGPTTPPEFGDAPEVFRQSIVCLDFVGRSGWPGEHVSGHRLPAGWRAEGAPICDGPRLYVLLRETTPAKEHSHVACFDAENGRRLWTRKLASGDVRARSSEGELEITNSLLTLAHGVLYANTNLGVVAALEAVDGRVKWTTAFPRASQMDLSKPLGYFYRDLNPCIYHEGTVFVAPNDTPAVFALDAATGRVWWSLDLPDATHLLGAVGDKLIASGDRLYWLQFDRAHPEAGAKLASWYGDGQPPGYGRGTLVGDVVYWPTEAEIHIFDQKTGVRRGLIALFAEPAFREKTGNLIVAGGKLLVAQPDRIVAFNQFSRRQRDEAQSITQRR
ncbi:MAG TPA: PQQ-binding-like beta-propeller repeat protein, partial [Pirellulales bacterium]